MISFLKELVYTLMEVASLSYIISLSYPYIRKENVGRKIGLMIGYALVLNVVTYSHIDNDWYYFIGNIMCIILDFIYCGLLVEKFRINNFFITMVYFSLLGTISTLLVSCLMHISSRTYAAVIWSTFRFALPLTSNILTALICKYLVARMDFIEQQLPRKYLYSFCFINLIEVISILILDVALERSDSFFILFVLILATVQMVLVNNYIISSSRIYLRNKELELANYSYSITRTHIKELEKEQERLHKFKHDINNHLEILQEINRDNPESSKYLQNIRADLNKVPKLVSTGNIFVDACLNAKIRNNEDIDYQVVAKLDTNLEISQDKLCSLLFNLIDNATEAAYESDEKKVIINMVSRANMLLIKIANSATMEYLGHSRKKGKYHGRGLIIVKEVVESYHGTMDFSYDGHWVECNVLLNKCR